MKLYRWISLLVVLFLFVSCVPGQNGGGFIPGFGSTATPLPTASINVTHAPDARVAMQAFLDAWKSEDYPTMYGMLTKVSQDAITQEDFATRYKDAMDAMSLADFKYQILSVLTNPYTAQSAFHVTYQSVLVGNLERDLVAHLALEEGQWRVQWDDGLILPELQGGNQLAMDYKIPARGDIYDRQGQAIVTQSEAYAIGIVPGQIAEKGENFLLDELSKVTGFYPAAIRALYEDAAPDWYIPVGEVSAAEAERLLQLNLGGLVLTPYQSRFYNNGGLASQTIGYTQYISPEQLEEYRRKGYRGDERVGMSGIEMWGEQYLGGKRGGSLYVIGKDGQIITRLGNSDPQPADSIYLTIDGNLQLHAQRAIAGFRGAVVVLERDTGRVLAMASSPGFDPNLFEPTNVNTQYLQNDLLTNTQQPLVNRATQGQYPLGSVFKIITFSAALESGAYTPETTYDCQYDFTELNDRVRHDWTWDHCQQELQATGECSTQPSGTLTLPEGLMRSCNPWFWHIGVGLFSSGRTTAVTDMARAFGLGQRTGIDQVDESTGNVTDPTDVLVAVNEAIGQDPILVTPLQVASFIAAVGNGGTLYRPQLIEKVQPVYGDPTVVFKPEARATLPLSPQNLKTLQDALISVVKNDRGTAHYRLRGLDIPVAGKTGTAESGIPGEPHAWFTGYTYASENTGLPDIAIAVVLENAGEGSDYAAPVFRRVVETYFYGRPQALYWWELEMGVTRTPTPFGGIPTRTPKKRP